VVPDSDRRRADGEPDPASASRGISDPTSDHLGCVEVACAALDSIQEYGVTPGGAAGLLVMHGLAMYARDTARAAAALLVNGRTLAAGALTRVVIEHAVLAQWLRADPEPRGQLFIQQSDVERARWFEVVLAANFDLEDPAHAALTKINERDGLAAKPKNVDEVFNTVKNLFGDTENGRQLYLTYRNLSKFVHPSAATFARYTEQAPYGLELKTQLQTDQYVEGLSF
jgi:hypothetical protein